MSALRKHPLAKADIEREARWYDAQKPGLGSDFLDEVNRALRAIGGQPKRYSVRFRDWRRANLRRFPHAIFYQIFGDDPVVFAVLHSRQDHRPILEGRRPTT